MVTRPVNDGLPKATVIVKPIDNGIGPLGRRVSAEQPVVDREEVCVVGIGLRTGRCDAPDGIATSAVINASASGSHVGGNTDFAGGRIEIIAHEYALADMRAMALMFQKPTGGGLPTRTFKDRLTVGSGADRLELYYLRPSTNRSSIFIVIPALRVLVAGVAFGGKMLPALTRPFGGRGVEYPNTLTKALALTPNVDMIITGHDGVATPRDLEVHRDFMRDFLESARQAKQSGKTAAAAAKAWRVPARSEGYTADPRLVIGGIETIYRQLSEPLTLNFKVVCASLADYGTSPEVIHPHRPRTGHCGDGGLRRRG